MSVSKTFLTLLLLAVGCSVHAQDIYLGGTVSGPSLDAGFASFGDDATADGDVGLDLRAGVGLGRFLGAELAWHDLGDLGWCRGCIDAGGGVERTVWSGGLTAGRTFGRARPFVKVGWFRASIDGSQMTIAGPFPIHWRESGPFGEVGVRVLVGKHAALRLAYERFDFEVEDAGALTLGAEYRFLIRRSRPTAAREW